jgi:hypothetical protein
VAPRAPAPRFVRSVRFVVWLAIDFEVLLPPTTALQSLGTNWESPHEEPGTRIQGSVRFIRFPFQRFDCYSMHFISSGHGGAATLAMNCRRRLRSFRGTTSAATSASAPSAWRLAPNHFRSRPLHFCHFRSVFAPCSMVKLLRGHRTPSPAYCARLVLALAIPLCSTEPAAASGRHPRGCLSRLPGWRWPLLQEREALALSPRFGLPDCVDPRGRPTVRSNCTSPLPSSYTDRRR